MFGIDQEFNPFALGIKEFLLYTLSLYDIRNPEKSISLIKKAKEYYGYGFISSAWQNISSHFEKYKKTGSYNDMPVVIDGETLSDIIEFHKIKRDKILDEVITFYESLSLKAHFVLSSYHVETIESFVDKLLELEKIYEQTVHTVE